MRRLCVLALVLVSGCGGSAEPERSNRLVDPSGEPPLINTLERDARTGDYLLTSNRGFFRINPRTDAVTRVKSSVTLNGLSSSVGKFLELSSTAAPGVFLGSGHPDQEGLPAYLGLMRSDDAGRSWQVLSRLGESDLHEIVELHDRLYAFDAVSGAVLISSDGGRTFDERATPKTLVLSMAVDPADPERIVISTDEEVYRSTDGGRRWRAIAVAEGPRLAWPAADALLRTDADGAVMRSQDGGETWQPVGRIESGEPYKLKAFAPSRLAVALADGAILESSDAGASWKAVFEP